MGLIVALSPLSSSQMVAANAPTPSRMARCLVGIRSLVPTSGTRTAVIEVIEVAFATRADYHDHYLNQTRINPKVIETRERVVGSRQVLKVYVMSYFQSFT